MSNHRSVLSLFLTWVLFGGLLTSNGANAESNWQQVNRAVVDEHLIPRYRLLEKSSVNLSLQARAFCLLRNETAFNQLKAAFHNAMDDWMSIQHMRFGPVALYLRYNRYQLWPDKHNTGSKQLRRLLVEKDRSILSAGQFPRTSVAVQGFTSMERLLFSSKLKLDDFSAQKGASYRCDLLEATARNIAIISSGVVKDWLSEELAFRKMLLNAQQGNDYFESSEEVSNRLLNNLHTQLVAIVDQKLLRPLSRYKLRRAESWRSRRSLRNILLNLQGVYELYDVGFAPEISDRGVDKEIRQAFVTAIDLADQITVPLYEIEKDSMHYKKLMLLLESSRQLKRLVASELPQSIGLTLGFNSLDGD